MKSLKGCVCVHVYIYIYIYTERPHSLKRASLDACASPFRTLTRADGLASSSIHTIPRLSDTVLPVAAWQLSFMETPGGRSGEDSTQVTEEFDQHERL